MDKKKADKGKKKKENEWVTHFGASVRLPIQMTDVMLQRTINLAKGQMTLYKNNVEQHGEEVAQAMKKALDREFKPFWHCIVGKDFGSQVTHEEKRFVFFRYENTTFLVFKIG